MDCPKEFKLKRDQIAEMLFMCKVKRCSVCNKVKLALPDEDEVLEKLKITGFGAAEALTNEIEEESLTVREVLRIKGILDNYEEESDSVLFDSLRRLQLMDLSLETLKAIEIGKSVIGLRKHGSKQIKDLVQTLIDDWIVMVDEWIQATKAIIDSTRESVKASVVEEEEEEEEEEE